MSEEDIAATQAQEKKKRKEYVRKTYEETSIVKGILEAIGMQPMLNAFSNADDLDGLSVAVEFKCKQRKETSGQKVVQDIARHVGVMDELSPVIYLSGDSKISKDMLTVKGSLSIDAVGKNLNSEDAMHSLADWLVEQIKSGIV